MTRGEGPLKYRRDNRNVGLGHEHAALMKKPTPRPGQAVNLHATPHGGNSERSGRALAGMNCCGPQTVEVRACCATRDKGLGFLGQIENGEPLPAPRLR